MLIQADAALIPLPDKSVHCVVTSPPYHGLRKYSGEQSVGLFPHLGLEPLFDCGAWHGFSPEKRLKKKTDGSFEKILIRKYPTHSIPLCDECHVCRMVAISRELWRVGRDDFVYWLNYGDGFYDECIGFNPHDIARALEADGWIMRNDVVWWKRNPMPESVNGWRWENKNCACISKSREDYVQQFMESTGLGRGSVHRGNHLQPDDPDPNCPKCHGTGKVGDPVLRKGSWRHTRAHEYIFQLVKNMNYYSNQEAVREEFQTDISENYPHRSHILGRGGLESLEQYPGSGPQRRSSGGYPPAGAGRNPRSVLDVPTQPYKGSHYATFPVNLIAPLIRASCPKRCCPECGAPWAPVVEKLLSGPGYDGYKLQKAQSAKDDTNIKGRSDGWWPNHFYESNVIDYRSTCPCDCDDHIPGIVLDPFIGSGTTGAVARELGRRWVGLDISMEYLDQQAKIRALKWTPSNALDDLPLFRESQ